MAAQRSGGRPLAGLRLGAAPLLLLAARPRAAVGRFEYDAEARVESARLFGNVDQYAYYFTDLLVGSPRQQRTSVIIDTGSRLVGFPCGGECEHCGSHLDPGYDTSQSGSLSWQTCTDCPGSCSKDQDRCPYKESYAEGSEISGFWFDDMVELGDAFSKNPPVRVTLGCHTNENKLFYSQRANGIMGLAPTTGVPNRPAFLESMFQDTAHVNTDVFAICLATWGGRLTVGGYNSSYHLGGGGGELHWVAMNAGHYYYVSPRGLSLGGPSPVELVYGPDSFGYTIVDSGTTYTYFPEAVYARLAGALALFCEQAQHGAVQVEDGCWDLDGDEAVDAFPPITFEFAEANIDWWPRSYLHRREGQTWCLAFQPSGTKQTVLGISFMQHKDDVVFDLGGARLGVADAACPEYREQPAFEQKFSAGPAAPRLGASLRAGSSRAAEPARTALAGAAARPGLASVGAAAALAAASLAALRARWAGRCAAHSGGGGEDEASLVALADEAGRRSGLAAAAEAL
ncbi:unnamed protein product [Prorocentrum cordatum]|uniref:Peptidase A1 domain-containing protein n=1 Tax=Prorocentrum cordatum TaxID=2364126 RepID=A0ABN9VN18_9DINO|nr:unnamed protein product [Polarella glacialis]